MKANLKTMTKALATLALATSTGLACAAGSATANLGVSATITANCTIATTAVAFGVYDPVSGADVTAAGTVVVACTKNASSPSIGLDNGAHYSSTRNMLGGIKGDSLAYSLLQPTTSAVGAACPSFGSGTAWTTAAPLTLTTPTTKAERTYNVCGQLAAGQDVSVDTYSDTVVATINF